MTVDPYRLHAQTDNFDSDVFLVGKILRRLKIDELPQIINIFLGDMSFVGPRPCLPHTFDEMPDWAKARFLVRPGLTGLAQVNGNIMLSWPERWRYDQAYVHHVTISKDLKIIFKSLLIVILGEEYFMKTL
jgi:lipopolysaccharide/colanic/teichoic acid biosynthesis glycosyltransferase